jgi:hypothetical protein
MVPGLLVGAALIQTGGSRVGVVIGSSGCGGCGGEGADVVIRRGGKSVLEWIMGRIFFFSCGFPFSSAPF